MTDTQRRIKRLLDDLDDWGEVEYALQYRLPANITTVAEALAYVRERREQVRQEIARLRQEGGDAQ
jgi:uncharacterized membrane protein